MRKCLVPLLLAITVFSCKKTNDGSSTNVANIPSISLCSQVWSKYNLDVTTYRNGDSIPQVSDPVQWASLTTGAWCYYNNDPANNGIYGKLYNWYAVNDPRGLAPAGWHIPKESEWTNLTLYCLGGDLIAGGKMKAVSPLWQSPNTGANNSSGFTGLPGGLRLEGGLFEFAGTFGGWWTADEANPTVGAWGRNLEHNSSNIISNYSNRRFGYSIRCVKD